MKLKDYYPIYTKQDRIKELESNNTTHSNYISIGISLALLSLACYAGCRTDLKATPRNTDTNNIVRLTR